MAQQNGIGQKKQRDGVIHVDFPRIDENELLRSTEDSSDTENESKFITDLIPEDCYNNPDGFNEVVAEFLIAMDMQQYMHNFKNANVSFEMFCNLTQDDLEVLGVCDSGHQKSMLHTISNLRKKQESESQSLASICGSVPDKQLNLQNLLSLMCRTSKHVDSLMFLLNRYNESLTKDSEYNTMLDAETCAAQGVEMLSEEAIVQAELLCVQLKEMLKVLAPLKPIDKQKRHRKGRKGQSKLIFGAKIGLIGTVLCLAISFIPYLRNLRH